jgi:hypothetical protein
VGVEAHTIFYTRGQNLTEIKPESQIDLLDIRGRANDALQAMRSHEQLDNLRFTSMEEKIKDVKKAVEDKGQEVKEELSTFKLDVRTQLLEIKTEMTAGFKSTDGKFWSLAITLIMMLLAVCGFLIVKTVFHG